MLRIYLTGDPCVTTRGRLLSRERMPGRQGRLAFAYLVSERTRPISRDELAEVLWPRRLPTAFEVALSAIISKLRALFEEAGASRRVLTSASGCYKLDLPAGSWVDVEVAKESVHFAEAALHAEDPRGAYGHAVVACSILRRPMLPGADGTWIEACRESLRELHLRALDCLAEIHTWNGEHALALRCAQEGVELEPFRESGYRRLMLLHNQAGNSAEALRVYSRLSALLVAELNTTPGPETRELFKTISGKRD